MMSQPMMTMAPEQALQILVQVTSHDSLKLSRQEYAAVDRALVVLQQAIAPPPPEPVDDAAASAPPADAAPEGTAAPPEDAAAVED